MKKLVILLLIFTQQTVFAETTANYGIHQDYVSTRALGMGNAFTAMADDYNTLFYNPAGLARIKKAQVNMFLKPGISSSFLKLQKDLDSAGTTGTEAEQAAAVTNLIGDNYGESFYGRLSLGGVWVRPRWGIAVIPLDLEINMSIHQQIGPFINLEAYQDTVIAYGYGREVKWSGRDDWYWGATVKGIYRGYVGKKLSAIDMANNQEFFREEDAQEGFTADIDLGLIFEPQRETGFLSKVKPSFAFVGRNLLDLGFKQNYHLLNDNSTEPPKLQRRFDIGSKWELPEFWKIFTVRALFDVRDMGHDNWNYMKGLHVGAEFDWRIANWWKGAWRAGLNQSYLTMGFTGKLAIFQLDLATWGEEIGTLDAKQQNRRYQLSASLDF
ncbi:MAG: hypothetical protein SGJ18_11050 [Pseudomonadota bacterium]|nr:hypothetical protein [Pseudomonadota bacterium]